VKVVLIVTSPKDQMCGVADYTYRLAQALSGLGAEVVLEEPDTWSLNAASALRARHKSGPDTVFHLQYPSLTMGNSLSPAALPLLLPRLFTTLHEFRLFSFPRKVIFAPHSLLDRRIIFSNGPERDNFQRFYPWSGKRLEVMPIGNNITRIGARADGPERLVYFGQISRNKGVEIFLETAALLRTGGNPIEIRMIGAMVDNDPAFQSLVQDAVDELGIVKRLSLPSDEVSEELSAATIALLPFPDGVSDKRGSALAALDHGVAVLTTHSPTTPDWLREVTHPIASAQDSAATITRILSGTQPRDKAPDVLKREMLARDWSEIARRHLALYREA
jgi:glycosyltransferase involved in cell wall biosynthesis